MIKRNQNINYEKLNNDLKNIDEVFKLLKPDENIASYFDLNHYTGKDNSKFYIISTDVQRLTKQMIYYFMVVFKNFNYTNIYDKEFIESFKSLVKDELEFKLFLEMISLSLDDFLHLGVYVCPTAFTSTLIKFIQSKYLNIKPRTKK